MGKVLWVIASRPFLSTIGFFGLGFCSLGDCDEEMGFSVVEVLDCDIL